MTVEIYRNTTLAGKGKNKTTITEWLILPDDEDAPELGKLSTLELAETLCKAMNWNYTINQ